MGFAGLAHYKMFKIFPGLSVSIQTFHPLQHICEFNDQAIIFEK